MNLLKKIDNSPLIIFRIFFGTILMLEAWGSIFTGWIERTFITPKIHFSFIPFEWLHPLDGLGMYYIYILMGALGLAVLLGYFYRIAIVSYTILWSYCYLTHKISYNNHYYLMILLCGIMSVLPAHKFYSLDVKLKRTTQENFMPYWSKFLLIFQISCVYFFGAIAKIYPDWLDGTFAKMILTTKASFPFIGAYFTKPWFYMSIAYGGLFFDLLIIPLLAYKRTRMFAFIISIFFHSFNSIVFQVGVFPYLSISFALFFFEGKTIQKIFFPKKIFFETLTKIHYKPSIKINTLIIIYVLLQLFLPLRQHLIKGTPFWTEEGHKMSWRMMLRSASGTIHFRVHNTSNDSTYIHYPTILTKKQKRLLRTHPDVIWQYAQYLKKKEAKKGNNIKVFAISKKRLNGRHLQEFINPNVDLASVKWNHIGHASWIREFKGW